MPSVRSKIILRKTWDTMCFLVARTLGSVIGVCIGCILGMLPLMWFDLAYTEKLPFRKD